MIILHLPERFLSIKSGLDCKTPFFKSQCQSTREILLIVNKKK